ncbi:MAG: carboxymuconolactone decarboxylase family protein [Desulfobacterales bacterium]|jgi:4-carboxymuconolactone decarboxylase|nr:MAG: carboxymuconolactone decarboxylase family protein [Desulfobacterales bacterium]
MSDRKIPSKHYHELFKLFPEAMAALENLGSTIRRSGPIDEKTIHLIQLAGAAATQSEGSVHSHTRRALEAGVTREEIYHALLLLVSTIGFPKVTAAFSWSKDVLDKQDKK